MRRAPLPLSPLGLGEKANKIKRHRKNWTARRSRWDAKDALSDKRETCEKGGRDKPTIKKGGVACGHTFNYIIRH